MPKSKWYIFNKCNCLDKVCGTIIKRPRYNSTPFKRLTTDLKAIITELWAYEVDPKEGYTQIDQDNLIAIENDLAKLCGGQGDTAEKLHRCIEFDVLWKAISAFLKMELDEMRSQVASRQTSAPPAKSKALLSSDSSTETSDTENQPGGSIESSQRTTTQPDSNRVAASQIDTNRAPSSQIDNDQALTSQINPDRAVPSRMDTNQAGLGEPNEETDKSKSGQDSPNATDTVPMEADQTKDTGNAQRKKPSKRRGAVQQQIAGIVDADRNVASQIEPNQLVPNQIETDQLVPKQIETDRDDTTQIESNQIVSEQIGTDMNAVSLVDLHRAVSNPIVLLEGVMC